MIYLDHNASSPLLPGVLREMQPDLEGGFGNPSSRHPMGMASRERIERARSDARRALGAEAGQLLFASGGTESVAMAFACGMSGERRTVVVSAVEHDCVLDSAMRWRQRGADVIVLPVNRHGIADPDALEGLLRSHPAAFVSLIWVNNETGVIAPVADLGEVCRKHGALIHLDGVQAATRIALDLDRVNWDYVSMAAHKFHGPKGAGLLLIRDGAPTSPVFGGHQEFGLRGGTENTAAIVGAAAALRMQPDWDVEAARQGGLRGRLEEGILTRVPGATVNASDTLRVKNTSNIFFPQRNAADLVERLGRAGVCVSAGAACNSGNGKPSHVLLAMGLDYAHANGSIRFSLGRGTSSAEIDQTIDIVCKIYESALPTSEQYERHTW